MSAAASVAPRIANGQSTSQRHTNSRLDDPRRITSMAANKPGSSDSLHRGITNSQSSSSGSRQANLARMARDDHEQINLAPSRSQRRSPSRERFRATASPARSDDLMRPYHRSTARTERDTNGEVPRLSPVATNGIARESGSRANTSAPRRRSNLQTSTGSWVLGKTIGQGSMGKVKLAKNLETGEQVAIKIVPRHSTDEHKSQQDREKADHSKEVRTAREAAIVTLLNHPYICGMRDVVRTHHHWYMLFEYVNGGQMLDYIISHGKLKEKHARKFGRQIASALDYCHRNSIVHRDLKIENILISKTGDIKIIDFGLSNLFSPRGHLKTFCGSLYFAAPELLQAKQYTGPEVDIWSFGIVLYVLVCGKVPFDDQSMPQLHAKIKKGVVDYPTWLSSECRNIISRMLVTDPRHRASLTEVMNHPWMTKGCNGPPENFLPLRAPLRQPLDQAIINKMTGFDFGSSDFIITQMEHILSSDEYQRALRSAAQRQTLHAPESDRKSRGMFDFYQRRKSANSKDALINASTTEITPLGDDPVNAFSPFVSIYYLVREKMDRERIEINPGALSIPQPLGEEHPRVPEIVPSEAAYTNPMTHEIAGEKPTWGCARSRARTYGEDNDSDRILLADNPRVPIVTSTSERPESTPMKKGHVGVGLLRRFSTRRTKDPERERTTPHLIASYPEPANESSVPAPLKSLGSRKPKDRENPPSTYSNIVNQRSELLGSPESTGLVDTKSRGLGRSTSMNAADLRSKWTRRGASEGPSPRPSLGDLEKLQSENPESATLEKVVTPISHRTRAAASRAKSMGHAGRENIQARRAMREQSREQDVPEETDQELVTDDDVAEASHSGETIKPVYLKGLFSVSTTSSKPLQVIRLDIIRTLGQLEVEFREIRGGFSCRHSPSIDLDKNSHAGSAGQAPSKLTGTSRRKISFAGIRGSERDELQEQHRLTQKTGDRRAGAEGSNTNSDESDEEMPIQFATVRAAGETTTHIQSDMGQTMPLRFEILVVKVPFFSLHGLQFKKVDGGTWQYKKMAETILAELKL